MASAADSEPTVTVTDRPDERARTVIADGLSAYNYEKARYRDYRPLAVVVSEAETGETVGGLYGRTSLGLLFVERFFLPETWRGKGLGTRVLALAEEEARRRGCTRAALMTLTFQAPGFYLKQGYSVAARLDCDPPGATRFLMTKKLDGADPV
ncbi:MAG TPA: GNAT family N-acetyltransferase [Stellaceae bacterium]|nr:GNAT family N-acetyltransferase [Stellaceae bacterium]